MCSLLQEKTTAADHVWLSPGHRLLSDSPLLSNYVLDLDDHALVLPPDLEASANMPLIVLGADCTLRLTNGTIYNSGSLAACLALGPGARFFAEQQDGVEMQEESPVHLGDPMAVLEKAQERAHGSFGGQSATSAQAFTSNLQVCYLTEVMVVF